MKKTGFPDRPKILEDVPEEQRTHFIPGRDQIFENIIQEEREFDCNKSESEESLSIYRAGLDEEDILEQQQEEEEEEEFIKRSI